MLLDLNTRDRHVAIKALALAVVATDQVPARRRPGSELEALTLLLRRLEPTDEELRIYTRAADWTLHEIVTAATAGVASGHAVPVSAHQG